MKRMFMPRLKNLSFLSLLGILTGGLLVDIALTKESLLRETPEIALPLGMLISFLILAYLLGFHSDGEKLRKRVCLFGWIGAFIGGVIGIWVAVRQLPLGIPITEIYDNALTAMHIGIAAGAVVGLSRATIKQRHFQQNDDRWPVLAESTWTNRPEPGPILVEIAEQLAELEGKDPLELEPLSAHINPDVFGVIRDGSTKPWQVLFYTDKYEIRVNSQGTVTVYDIHTPDEERVMNPSVQVTQWTK